MHAISTLRSQERGLRTGESTSRSTCEEFVKGRLPSRDENNHIWPPNEVICPPLGPIENVSLEGLGEKCVDLEVESVMEGKVMN